MRFDVEWIIIGKMTCPWCEKSVQLAKDYGLTYVFVPTTQLTEQDMNRIKLDSGVNYGSIPMIYHNGRYIGGYAEFQDTLSSVSD